MKESTRRYVYKETYDEVMLWAKKLRKINMISRPPNNKDNFPFYLKQYILHLKFLKK